MTKVEETKILASSSSIVLFASTWLILLRFVEILKGQ
jgi:hypothetical protein